MSALFSFDRVTIDNVHLDQLCTHDGTSYRGPVFASFTFPIANNDDLVHFIDTEFTSKFKFYQDNCQAHDIEAKLFDGLTDEDVASLKRKKELLDVSWPAVADILEGLNPSQYVPTMDRFVQCAGKVDKCQEK